MGGSVALDAVDFFFPNCYNPLMPLTMNIPDEIVKAFPDEGQGPDRRVIESVILELYRDKAISAGKVAELLEMSRSQAEEFLCRHGVMESPTWQEVEKDSEFLQSFLGGE
jgi:predicted HTH domain antitoxin